MKAMMTQIKILHDNRWQGACGTEIEFAKPSSCWKNGAQNKQNTNTQPFGTSPIELGGVAESLGDAGRDS